MATYKNGAAINECEPCTLQMMTILPVVLGRFEVRLAEHMGDWNSCWQKQTFAFVLRLSGGMWMHFHDRALV